MGRTLSLFAMPVPPSEMTQNTRKHYAFQGFAVSHRNIYGQLSVNLTDRNVHIERKKKKASPLSEASFLFAEYYVLLCDSDLRQCVGVVERDLFQAVVSAG